MTDRRTDRRTDGQTDRRNCDSICALSIDAVARKNLVMNESQPSVTKYLSANSSEYSHSMLVVSKLSTCQTYGSAMALTLSFDTIMTAISIFLGFNSS